MVRKSSRIEEKIYIDMEIWVNQNYPEKAYQLQDSILREKAYLKFIRRRIIEDVKYIDSLPFMFRLSLNLNEEDPQFDRKLQNILEQERNIV